MPQESTSSTKSYPLHELTSPTSFKQPPIIDSYDALTIPWGFALFDRSVTNDQQPFPLYGEVDVWWDTPGARGVVLIPDNLDFSTDKSQTVRITNVGVFPATVSDVFLSGSDSFRIVGPSCLNVTIPPNGICGVALKYGGGHFADQDATLSVLDDMDAAPKTRPASRRLRRISAIQVEC
jgi:hypothetical protein